jgi:hypothetical protein
VNAAASRPLLTQNRLLLPHEIYRVGKCRVDHPPHSITRCRELIAVAVAQIDRDPVVRDRLVDPALEIAVAYVEKIIALKYAARRYPVAHENAEDLAADLIVGWSVKHGAPAFEFSNIKRLRACRTAAPVHSRKLSPFPLSDHRDITQRSFVPKILSGDDFNFRR